MKKHEFKNDYNFDWCLINKNKFSSMKVKLLYNILYYFIYKELTSINDLKDKSFIFGIKENKKEGKAMAAKELELCGGATLLLDISLTGAESGGKAKIFGRKLAKPCHDQKQIPKFGD